MAKKPIFFQRPLHLNEKLTISMMKIEPHYPNLSMGGVEISFSKVEMPLVFPLNHQCIIRIIDGLLTVEDGGSK
jgi:hypothetical protein